MADQGNASHVVTCPLCKGQGSMEKDLLVIRSREPEFHDILARYWDDTVSSDHGGLENPFESREEACALRTGTFHSTGAGVPKE